MTRSWSAPAARARPLRCCWPARAARAGRRPAAGRPRHPVHPRADARRGGAAVAVGAARRAGRGGHARPARQHLPLPLPGGEASETVDVRPAGGVDALTRRGGPCSTRCWWTRPGGQAPRSGSGRRSSVCSSTGPGGSSGSRPGSATARCARRRRSRSAPTACGPRSRGRWTPASPTGVGRPVRWPTGTWPGSRPSAQLVLRPGHHGGRDPDQRGWACVWAGVPSARFGDLARPSLARGLDAVLARVAPELAEHVRAVASDGPVRGFPGVAAFQRVPAGPGWALVGDAGYFKDPITAHGITDALRDAELLADAVVAAAAGDHGAFEEYHRTRDALSTELRDVTERIAGYRWDRAELYGLLRELSAAQRAENRWLAAKQPEAPGPSGLRRRRGPLGRSALPPAMPETYGLSMELLERDAPLDCLTAALASATAGAGRVALVSGGAGLGKTAWCAPSSPGWTAASPVHRGALVGACDDLPTPRPLGPVHDMSPRLPSRAGRALARGRRRSRSSPRCSTSSAGERPDRRGRRGRALGRRRQPRRAGLPRPPRRPAAARCWCSPIATTRCRVDRAAAAGARRAARPRRGADRARPAVGTAVTQLAGRARRGAAGATPRPAATRSSSPSCSPPSTRGSPASVSHAVLARVARLPEPTRALLDLLAVVPARAETGLLDVAVPGLAGGRRGGRGTRRAHRARDGGGVPTRAGPPGRRGGAAPRRGARRLHARVLAALRARGADPARLVHHAERAGDDDTLVEVAPAGGPRGGRRRRPPGGRRALPPGAEARATATPTRAGRPAGGVHRRGVDDLPASATPCRRRAGARPAGGAGATRRGWAATCAG